MDMAALTTRIAEGFRRSRNLRVFGLVSPGAFWLIIFFTIPLLFMLVISFVEKGRAGGVRVPLTFTTESYTQFINACASEFAGPNCDALLYVGIFAKSAYIGLVVTVLCLLVGYPLAYFIVKRGVRWRNLLLLLVMIPFWTNFLVRTYALRQMLTTSSLLDAVLFQGINLGVFGLDLHVGVLLGLMYGYLPFAVLPMYASIEKFDFALMEAAEDLGANNRRAFWRIMLPMTLPGVVAAFVLVFVPVVGAFVTPDLMSSGKVEMIGTLIYRQFLGQSRNWPFGSAISFVMMLLVLAGVVYYLRSGSKEERAL
jgi:spermidine/putrescine transport system permease protein